MTRRVGVLVYDDVEVLDVCGPFEVLSVTNRLAARAGRPAPFEVGLIGAGPVTARGGLQLGPVAPLHLDLDVVLVPGGVHDVVMADPDVLAWLRAVRPRAELVASVCTGAFVLAAAGLLDARPVTTHAEDVADLRATWPALDVREGVRFLDHGDLATSGGISAGIDLALHLVGRLVDPAAAEATARSMEYERRG